MLLVEQLDAFGAAPADAHARRRTLHDAGLEATLAILEPEDAPWRSCLEARPEARRTHTFSDNAQGWEQLRACADQLAPRLVLWAAAEPGKAAASLAASHIVRSWPTGCSAARATIAPLAPALAAPHAAFAWTSIDAALARRGRLSLWDGPYVLAPTALAGRAGKHAIEAFARSIRGRDAFDLVVLAHPQPAFEELATRIEVGMRVHFAGPAPREAELAWLQHATAVMFAGTAALSAGLPLRALASGCPVLVADGAAIGLGDWLTAEQVGASASDERALALGLASAMDGAVALEVIRERGRKLAARCEPEAIARAFAALNAEEGLGLRAA